MKYQIKNASITIKGETILDDINFEIINNNHIGIVGRNGAGKTTLLKALIDNEMFEEGVEETPFEIIKIGDFKIGCLDQITFKDENVSLIEEIKKAFPELVNLEKKIDFLLEKINSDASKNYILEYSNALDRYKALGGYSYQKEYEVMLNKFGFKESDKDKKIKSFSGGERTKIAFIKLLLSKPDILFLDEPTNHLDIEAIVWLENYLKNYKGAFVVVSHDRMFLNNIVNIIYDISHGKVTKYSGNYEYYEKKKQKDYERQLSDYEAQQKEIARLKTIYEKFRFKPSKAKMAMSRLHMIERMEIIEKPLRESRKTFKTVLDKIEPSGKNVFTCQNLEIGYSKPLATCTFEIMQGQKIGVIGANGTGKSTLLKTIYGLIKPLSGTRAFGYNVKIGYFDQNLEFINDQNTIIEEFKSTYPDALQKEARSALGAFLFSGEEINKKVCVLSGGEKVRLQLCKILYSKPNFLILDEPTNHMDLMSKEALEKILEEYKGTIIFVSHDRYFIKKLATDIIIFGNDNAKYYPFGYEEVLKRLENGKEQSVPEKKINNPESKKTKMSQSKQSEKELSKIERKIIEYEKRIKELNEKMYDPNVYNDFNKSNEIKKEIETTQILLNELNEKWNELAESLS